MLLGHKTALVTGSTHNIGLGIARAFAREGATVIVHSRHEQDAKRVASDIGGDFFAADVSDAIQVPQCSITSKSNINVWIFSLTVWRSHPKVGSWTFL